MKAANKQILRFSRLLKHLGVQKYEHQEFVRHWNVWRAWQTSRDLSNIETAATVKRPINLKVLEQIAQLFYELEDFKSLREYIASNYPGKHFSRSRNYHLKFWKNKEYAQTQDQELSPFYKLLFACPEKSNEYLEYLENLSRFGSSAEERLFLMNLAEMIMQTSGYNLSSPKLPEFKSETIDGVERKYLWFTGRSTVKIYFTKQMLYGREQDVVKIERTTDSNPGPFQEHVIQTLTSTLWNSRHLLIRQSEQWLNLYQELRGNV